LASAGFAVARRGILTIGVDLAADSVRFIAHELNSRSVRIGKPSYERKIEIIYSRNFALLPGVTAISGLLGGNPVFLLGFPYAPGEYKFEVMKGALNAISLFIYLVMSGAIGSAVIWYDRIIRRNSELNARAIATLQVQKENKFVEAFCKRTGVSL